MPEALSLEGMIGGQMVKMTCSVGAAKRRDGESGDEWLRRADQAMYAAKASAVAITETPTTGALPW